MNIKLVTRVVGSLLILVGIVMMTSVLVSWLMGDSHTVIFRLFTSSAIVIAFGGLVRYFSRNCSVVFGFREGFGIVTFGWLFAAIFGALPYVLVSYFNWYDAFFETMSGFTTTGSSVIDNGLVLMAGAKLQHGLKSIPYGLLYWRSVTHWLGGMGIVVLSLAILPSLGISAQQLYIAEVPGPTQDQITPRIASSAKILWGVYVLFTVLEVIFLSAGGMSLFDSWCTTCGTMATGGFSTQQASIGAYNSLYIDIIVTVFMFLAGTNFVLHYRFLRGKPLFHFKDEEFRFYLFITIFAIISMTLFLKGREIITTTGATISHPGFLESLRYSSFQAVSILTTTGFTTADFNQWPAYCALLLIGLMFLGGCGGSTGGGMKNSRVLLLIKYAIYQIERRIFVRSLPNVKLNKHRITEVVLNRTVVFFFIFVATFVVFTLLLCCLGVNDIVTAFSASIASLSNIGPGLGMVGATSTYAWMSPAAKVSLSLEMLMGRLELYTVLVIFLPTFWKR